MINQIQNFTEQKSFKLPIRLRLKRPSHSQNIDEPSQNPECSLHEILRVENLKLRESVNQLERIEIVSKNGFGVGDRESDKKKKRKDNAFLGAVGVMKEILKYLYKETEDMAKKEFDGKRAEGKENSLVGVDGDKEGKNGQEERQLPNKREDVLDDGTEEYSELFRMYSELKSEVSEMEHYIIRLKEELNTKEKEVQHLENNTKIHAAHNTLIENQYLAKHNECTIMKEEILGYEQKIENLESELIETRRCKSDRVFVGERGHKKSENELNEANEGSQSSVEKVSAVSVGEESLDDSQFRKELENSKLDEIFEKTERVLKKCKSLEEKLEVKEAEIGCLKDSLNKIVEFLGLKSKYEDENSLDHPSADSIISEISSKINENFDKLEIRETQIETMVSKELNKILCELEPHKNFDEATIHEKIEQILLRVKNRNVEERPQQYIDLLLNLHSQIEDVITHAGEIEYEMNKNNEAVADLIDDVVEKESLISSLKEMENLLLKNEHSFTDQNFELFEHFKAICVQNGLDASKINSYLTELEGIVKGMHKSHSEEAKKYKDEIEELKVQLNQFQGFNVNQKSEEIFNLKEKMMESFYPSSPEFVESILQRIVEVKNSNSSEDTERLISNIFEEIRDKDEKLKLEMSRKKEVMKQRSAAISQICRKGISIKDSSHELKNKPSLDDS